MINSGCYNFGNFFLILLNIFFINKIEDDNSHFNDFDSNKWRLVNLLSSLPVILSFFIILIFQNESPLYLLNKNRLYEAFIVLENINQGPLGDEERIKIRNSIVEKKNYNLKSDYRELFYKDYRLLTINSLLICSICFLNMIGISYLVPKTIIQLGETKTYNLSYNSQLLIYGSLQLPNGFLGGWMTESRLLGRKKTLWITSVLCGLFYFISYICPRYMCFFAGEIMLFNSIAYGCGYIYVTEVFPTNLRDQAQSLIQFCSFLLGAWSPYVIDYFAKINILFNFLILGATCFICAFIAFYLPIETLSRPLDQDLELKEID
jgi:hypothetical protein